MDGAPTSQLRRGGLPHLLAWESSWARSARPSLSSWLCAKPSPTHTQHTGQQQHYLIVESEHTKRERGSGSVRQPANTSDTCEQGQSHHLHSHTLGIAVDTTRGYTRLHALPPVQAPSYALRQAQCHPACTQAHVYSPFLTRGKDRSPNG